MIKYKITYSTAGVDHVENIELPSKVTEITMLTWCRFKGIPAPNNLKDIVTDKPTRIGFEDWSELISYCSKVLKIFSVSEAAILNSKYELSDDQSDGFLAMFIQVLSVLTSYKEKYRKRFTHKGIEYEFPEIVQQGFGQTLVGGKMTMGMAADSLQIEHVLSQTDENGKFVMDDQMFWKDISVIAAISRKVLPDGNLEKVQSFDWVQRREWLDKRTTEFETLPMDIALDGCFFLPSLKSKLMITLSSALHFRNLLLIQLSNEQSKQMPISGKSGTGIPSSMK